MVMPVDYAFADALPDGIVCINANSQFLWWNTAAAQLLQLEGDHINQNTAGCF